MSSSSRTARGASGRQDLFQQPGGGGAGEEKSGAGPSSQGADGGPGAEAVDDDSPLQLEHILGYAGAFRNCCLTIPGAGDGRLFAKALGSLLVVENLLDAHDQKLLRGHDSPISAVAVSGSGSLLASGQIGTEKFRGRAAPIFLWDPHSGRRLNVLRGLTTRVNAMAFSADERFLCGCGEDCLVYVWDVQTGETVSCQRVLSPPSVCKWVYQQRVSHYTSYEVVVDVGASIVQGKLQYDPSKVQWSLKFSPYATPAGGALVRSYTCVEASADRAFIFVGTSAGEVHVYRREPALFRACIPVCQNGVQALAVLPQSGNVVVGGGDGTLKMLSGEDMGWELVLDCSLGAAEGRVRALSCTSSGAELLVACSTGSILRCMSDSFAYTTIGHGNTSAVSCIAFTKTPGGSLFATGSKAGELRVWDVTDYACLATFANPKAEVMSVCLVDDNTLLSGWSDGFIRAHDTQTLNRQLWYIPTAHRGGARSLAAHSDASSQFFVSGGADGTIRVWRLANRELVTQYTEHTKAVARVLVDTAKPNVIHSVGVDCTVLSYDLRAARRLICHLVTTGGGMTDMTQRRDGEHELITCDTQARLLHWDVDVRDPVLAVQDPALAALRCALVSPSGRFLAFAGDDQTVKVLDLAKGQIVALGGAHCSPILSLAWTPDERQVVSGGDDSCICIWNFYLA